MLNALEKLEVYLTTLTPPETETAGAACKRKKQQRHKRNGYVYEIK